MGILNSHSFFSILGFMVRFSSKQMVWYRGTGRTSCWARSQLSCRLGLWKADVECFTMFYPLKIVIFHSYLSLPEGTIKKIAIYSCFEPEMLQKQLSFTMFDPNFLWYTRRWMTSVVSKKKRSSKKYPGVFLYDNQTTRNCILAPGLPGEQTSSTHRGHGCGRRNAGEDHIGHHLKQWKGADCKVPRSSDNENHRLLWLYYTIYI